MKDSAKIFFVITKGVITGSHAARFRNFEGFKNVKLWTFSKRIEKVFNIDFICLLAQKGSSNLKETGIEFPTYNYKIKAQEVNLQYFSVIDLELENISILVPYGFEIRGNKTFTKKLISKEAKKELLPNIESTYKKLFHKGADLNPRNLIFVSAENVDKKLVKINPDNRIFKKAKVPWKNIVYNNRIIEKKYLFKVFKSTELVKFYIYDCYTVFLPISNKNLSFNYESLDNNAKEFYDHINLTYLKNKKSTTKHNSLMENIDRWGKLINTRQLSKIKVVYNNSGSILNSSVVQGDFLITGDLSFFDTDNLDEA